MEDCELAAVCFPQDTLYVCIFEQARERRKEKLFSFIFSTFVCLSNLGGLVCVCVLYDEETRQTQRIHV